jgi:hypothetical protein
MTRAGSPAAPDADVVKGQAGRHVAQEEPRRVLQGPKASRSLHHEAASMTAAVPIRASVIQAPLDIAGESIYDNALTNPMLYHL